VTFIDNYLTEEFCHAQKLFIYDYNPKTGMYQISDRDFQKVKQRLLLQLTNLGQPLIEVVDANYRNRGSFCSGTSSTASSSSRTTPATRSRTSSASGAALWPCRRW